MNPITEVHANDKGEPKSLSENINGDIAERMEVDSLLVASALHNQGKPQDGLHLKQGSFSDFPASKISEWMKLKSLETASVESHFSVANNILDESIERKSGDIPCRVASVLKLVVQEIEQRVSKQGGDLKKQNNLFKSREDRYHSKIRALETLATGTTEENQVVMNQLNQMKIEKQKLEEKRKLEEQNIIRIVKKKDQNDLQILTLKGELESVKETYEKLLVQLEAQAKETKTELEKRLVELEGLLDDSRNKAKELETFAQSKSLRWRRRELGYKNVMDVQVRSLQELKLSSDSIKQEVLQTQKIYSKELRHFGSKLKGLIDAAQNYHSVLAENRKLYNEVQDLKGTIRVYCRIRPFLPGQSEKQTTIDYFGENGELVVTNPTKQGKDTRRHFKFNKVFGPTGTQEEVFLDIQPLIRSVLDGYNVCIFAYGQTGSGKTYTMTGPNTSCKEDWGVNYRALNDLFYLSQSRKGSFTYEVGVQMLEIYNEQVRDLLSDEASRKRLGIWSTTQPNGLAVPDASMHPVKSTADVLELMNIGLMNRAVGATALNERSSRSHSVLTVHVRGVDLETDAVLHGSLHLVDLAGSERVDRSEATGDRLREAKHINKSLSALGDVIFALAQKSPHVPYRNSKLTKVLQSSLGGQAKTLMFVQLNPDVDSYSETISTLKFAERVSGVELGAARSNKEGRGVRELMEQLASLKDVVAKKDEEIGRLRMQKTNSSREKRDLSSPRHGLSSPRRHSMGTLHHIRTPSWVKSSGVIDKGASDSISEYSDKHSEAGSQRSIDEFRHHKEFFQQAKLAVADGGQNLGEDVEIRVDNVDITQNVNDDVELLGFGGKDSDERLSDISDSVLSMETDVSMNSIVEFTLFPEPSKAPPERTEKSNMPSKIPRPSQKQMQTIVPSRLSLPKSSLGHLSSSKKAMGASSSVTKISKRWQ